MISPLLKMCQQRCWSNTWFRATHWEIVGQLPVQPVETDSSTWQHFRRSAIRSSQWLILPATCLGETHYNDVIMGTITSKITSLTIVCSIVYSDADQRKHQSSASLAFVRGIHRGPVNSQHKWPVTRKMFPFDDVIMPENGIMYTDVIS